MPIPFSLTIPSGFMCRQSGFTLIELLVTCAILAALAYVTWGAYAGVNQRANDELAQTELLQLADALRRFHGDTGYWPGTGPFRPSSLGGALLIDAAADPDTSNMALLFEPPSMVSGHPLAFLRNWDAESRRGWNGPYLSSTRHARPFLFQPPPNPRAVYLGADGRYGGTNAANPCLPNASDPDGVDDLVICL